MTTFDVTVPAYPYDAFAVELGRDDRGALWRGRCKIAEVARTWDGWDIDGVPVCRGALTDEAITAAIDRAVAAGTLVLTRVAPTTEEENPR